MSDSAQGKSVLGRYDNLFSRPLVLDGMLVLATFLLYTRSIFAGFVYDDSFLLKGVQYFTGSSVLRLFVENIDPEHCGNFYRPLTALWQKLVSLVSGVNPMPWHLSAIVLHAVCVVLVYHLACRLLKEPFYGIVAAVVFLVHPTHVEAVTWIADAADLLLTIAILGAALALLRWAEDGNPLWWVLAWTLSLAGCLVKEIGVVAPALLLALLFWKGKRLNQPDMALTVSAYGILVLGFLAWRNHVLQGFAHPLSAMSTESMLITAPAALWFYVCHLFFPFSLGPFYPVAAVGSVYARGFLLPLLGLIVIAAIVVIGLLRSCDRGLLLVCAVWGTVPVLPALYLKLFPSFELVHDRYLYIPSIALGIALAYLLQRCAIRKSKWAMILVAGLLLLAGVKNIAYQGIWSNDNALFKRAIELTPENDRAVVNLAVCKLNQGLDEEGIVLLKRALAIKPDNAFALYDLGNLAFKHGDFAQASFYMEKALMIELHPEWAVNLAWADYKQGKLQKAQSDAIQVLRISPQEPGAHLVMGMVEIGMGDVATGAQEIRTELQFYPNNRIAQEALASAERKLESGNN